MDHLGWPWSAMSLIISNDKEKDMVLKLISSVQRQIFSFNKFTEIQLIPEISLKHCTKN